MQPREISTEHQKFIDAIDEGDSASPIERKLSTTQKLWCLYFVQTGGNSLKAAELAGYATPLTASHKNMVHEGCLTFIRRLSVRNVNLLLPQLFARLYAIATDPETSARAAVDAANSLIDRVVPPHPKGPSTAIQINNGTAADGVLKGQAQVIIKELWDIRETREQRKAKAYDAVDRVMDAKEQRKRSDIVDRMSDNPDPALQLLEHIAHDDGRGGELSQGPVGSPSSIPAPPPTHDENFQKESEDDGENECSRGTIGGDPTGGFGRGEGAAGSVQWVAGGGDIIADEGGGGIDAEVFSGLHAADAEGFGRNVGVEGGLARGTALWSGAASGSHLGGFGREHSVAGDIGEAAGRSEADVGGNRSGQGGVDLFADD